MKFHMHIDAASQTILRHPQEKPSISDKSSDGSTWKKKTSLSVTGSRTEEMLVCFQECVFLWL